MTGTERSDLKLLLRVFRRARAYWPFVALLFVLSLLSAPLALLAPLPVKIVVDNVLGSQPLPEFIAALCPSFVLRSGSGLLLLAVGLLFGTTLLRQLLETATELLRTWTGQRLVVEFRSELFRVVQRLSFTLMDSRGTADLNYRIQHDAPAVEKIVVGGLLPMISAALTIGGMLYVSARIDWQLAVVACAVCPVFLLTIRFFRRRLRQRSRDVHRLESAALSVIHEVLSAIRVVKAFGQEKREEGRFIGRSAEGMKSRIDLVLAEGTFGLLVGIVTVAGTSCILYLGVRHVQSGILTLGDLLIVLGYLAQMYTPLRALSKKVARSQSYLASAERAFALIDESPDVLERPGARALNRVRGSVVFRDVQFAYDSGEAVLRDLSFEIPPGTCIGIAGRTGVGKTTIVSLLPRFYDPTSGEIRIDGVDLRDYKIEDLRRQFAIVLQEPVLFSTSIAENIAYARPEASQSEIIAAATAAGAHDFIVKMPQAYQTLVGERGMRLSGGERQRIALARAFLKDAPILILDEPTSAVDMKTEASIMETLEDLIRGRTTFLITHRKSLLKVCDTVLILENGRIVPETTETGVAR